jgi:hypothetical protein
MASATVSAPLRERYDRYELAAIHALLSQWGAICEQQRNWSGYPTGHEGNGSGLPIPDIPTIAVRINQKIMALPDDEQNAVTIWYAWQCNPGGGWWSPEDKALVLGINIHTLRSRVRKAKCLLLQSAAELI